MADDKYLQGLAGLQASQGGAAGTSGKKKVNVDIISDVVCPFCWIGKRHLEEAISKSPDVEFQVRWLPYQLNSRSPEEPSSRIERYMEKFGSSREQVLKGAEGMKRQFAAAGLEYRTEGPVGSDGDILTGNTREAHRVLTAALKEGGPEMQDKAAEALFYGYFAEGRAPNEPALLEAAAVAAGLDPGIVGDKSVMGPEVDTELEEARKHVQSGVPHFMFSPEGGEPVAEFSGAQPVDQMLRAIAKASK